MLIKWLVYVDPAGEKIFGEVEADDNASDEEISKAVNDHVTKNIKIYWRKDGEANE